MKKLFFLILISVCANFAQSQNLPLIEPMISNNSCPTSKVSGVVSALKPYADAKKIVEVIGDVRL